MPGCFAYLIAGVITASKFGSIGSGLSLSRHFRSRPEPHKILTIEGLWLPILGRNAMKRIMDRLNCRVNNRRNFEIPTRKRNSAGNHYCGRTGIDGGAISETSPTHAGDGSGMPPFGFRRSDGRKNRQGQGDGWPWIRIGKTGPPAAPG